MNIKSSAAIPITFVFLMAIGCAEADPSKSSAIERATSVESTLTSTGVPSSPEPAAPHWRTWAHTRHAKATGLWRVEIRSVEGSLLASVPFEVEQAD
jgi:Protein of unknown function (DUF2914)